MEKMKLSTPDLTQKNIEKLSKLFPNVVKEGKVDFELLKQMLSHHLIDDCRERYGLNWVGKKKSILRANIPIKKTLRPLKEKSVDFEKTKNIYIEGDNLETLKIIQESYLGKIKMIYIDPPYNTGKDFIYKDNFKQNKSEYNEASGAIDEEGVKLFRNTLSNGRFHSDWLSMMYERLLVARDLLREDGVIFISIDDNEVHNLRHICDEIFGEGNFVGIIPRTTSFQRSGQEKYMNISHDYVIVYSYSNNFNRIIQREVNISKIKKDHIGYYIEGDTKALVAAISQGYSKGGDYDFEFNGKIYKPITKEGVRNRWLWTKERMETAKKLGILRAAGNSLRMQIYLDKRFDEKTNTMIDKDSNLIFHTADFVRRKGFDNPTGTRDVSKLFDNKKIFDNPKPVNLIKDLTKLATNKNSLILDFFSGSATTAHAVMELNAEDGGNRQFIMVQLPEPVDEKSEAYKAGYRTIAEIGRERIIRAARKIKEEYLKKYEDQLKKLKKDEKKLIVNEDLENKIKEFEKKLEHIKNLDCGFRYFKVDTSNFKEAKYIEEITQETLINEIENIKPDRNDLDLLFEIILNLGLELTLDIDAKEISGKKVYFVEYNSLIACFDNGIEENLAKELAKYNPLKIVLKDSSFKTDSDKINFEQTIKELSQDTEVLVV